MCVLFLWPKNVELSLKVSILAQIDKKTIEIYKKKICFFWMKIVGIAKPNLFILLIWLVKNQN